MFFSNFNQPHFLLINKPIGWTSFDAVAHIRSKIKNFNSTSEYDGILKQVQDDKTNNRLSPAIKKSRRAKVGHAGTLDPFAGGLLIVGVGREATKRLDEFKKLPKTYVAVIKLGEISTTGDCTGEISNFSLINPALETINKVLTAFIGQQTQIPPMHSAKKVNGQKLYNLARRGIEIERQPEEIKIYNIKLLSYDWPFLKIEVSCSAGTYIRTLAENIGSKLKTGAYCHALTRTRIGDYKVEDAAELPIKTDFDELPARALLDFDTKTKM